jgi:activating signal cointegrator 1
MTRIGTISLHQPYASLVVAGIKTIETRGWYTKHRGLMLIHAAKRRITKNTCPFLDLGAPEIHARKAELPFGAIIGVVEIADVVKSEDAPLVWRDQNWCGDFRPGRFCWILTHARAFKAPIFTPGRQNFWSYDIDLEKHLA